MLTHIFNTAKRILSRSPSAQEHSIETEETAPITHGPSHGIEVTMVTTRRGTETPGQEVTPRSSAKRKVGKRELEALDTPTAVKRQRKSPPKKKEPSQLAATTEEDATQDSTEDTSDTIAVSVPATEAQSAEGKLPIRRRSSPKVVVAKLSPPAYTQADGGDKAIEDDVPASTQDSVYETPDQHSGSVYATPATRKKVDGSPTPRDRRHNERASAKKSSGRKKKTSVESEDNSADVTPTHEQAPITSQDAPFTPSQPEKAHVRFGSEEPTTTQQSITMNLQGHKRYEALESTQDAELEDAMQVDDDDASDSDEAPEVVTTTAAVSKARASERDTARALLAQETKELIKRKTREKLIADQQAEKRKREEHKAKKLAKQIARQQSAIDEQSIETEAPAAIDRNNLPALLPTSLLSNLSDQRAPTPPPARRGKTEEELRKEKLNHHIKFLERTDKGPKDLKKGKLSVAVLRQQNKFLPPKANRDTRNVREKWLKGRQVETRKVKGGKGIGGKVERRAFGNRGFLRGED
ncbi:hypothetical protein CC86DRAFT_302699 [Ophiobolus disseminans]|uniref:Uncharacterized protein n=1 Tax=Ophiobolus disseminans TaxID=1469910 RepID=A0A6A6ZK09_9PLEO|nr:hypothetical protein CC86DRAFT_302699 [Ophiobolus disseminans]